MSKIYIYAFCWRTGVIDFNRKVPKGALVICHTKLENKTEMQDFIDVTARHAYNGNDLLVPGLPEATDDEEAKIALTRWIGWISTRKGKVMKKIKFNTSSEYMEKASGNEKSTCY